MKPFSRLTSGLAGTLVVSALAALAEGQAPTTAASDKLSAKAFEFIDGRPELTRDEFIIYVRHAFHPDWRRWDQSPLDGVMDEAQKPGVSPGQKELSDFLAKEAADQDLGTISDFDAEGKSSISVADAETLVYKAKVTPTRPATLFGVPLEPLKIRSTPDELSVDPALSKPAIFGYTHDFNKDTDKWQATGVVLYAFTDAFGIKNLTIAPSIAFDRVVSSEKNDPANPPTTKEVNSLIPRLQAEYRLETSGGPFENHYFRLNAAYATDFDLDAQVPTVEFQWEPSGLALNNGVANRIPLPGLKDLPVLARTRVMFHSEAGWVLDAGDKAKLLPIEHDGFLRLGPKLQLELFPDAPNHWLKRLGLLLDYTHTNDVLNDGDGSDLFSATGTCKLDDAGNFLLTAQYRTGDTAVLQDSVNTFYVGLGFKL